MKKAIVIGCPGSGKTTFSEKLAAKTGLPLIYLDAVWHRPDKTHITREDFNKRLSEILEAPAWIIDGNYSRTLVRRLAAADTVFLFDLPTEVCLEGAKSRLGKGRYDMPWIAETLDPTFEAEIENFKTDTLPGIYRLLDKYREGRRIEVFRSRREADAFIAALSPRENPGK